MSWAANLQTVIDDSKPYPLITRPQLDALFGLSSQHFHEVCLKKCQEDKYLSRVYADVKHVKQIVENAKRSLWNNLLSNGIALV